MKWQIALCTLMGLAISESRPMDAQSKAEVADFLLRHPDMEDNTVNTDLAQFANCSRARPLELYILQDGTSTFQSLLRQVQQVLPPLVDELAMDFKDFRGGLTTFADRPTKQSPKIPCLRQDLKMTDDIAAFRAACGSVSFLAGTSDGYPENSIETLAFAAGSHAGFSKPSERPDAIRIAIIITDAQGRLMRNPPGPANPNLANEMICEVGADFPPLTQVAQILSDADVYPLALITETYTKSLIHWWKMVLFDDLNDRMNLPKETGLVVPFDMTADSMVKAIHAGVLALDCKIEEFHSSTTTTTTTTTTTEGLPTTTEPVPTGTTVELTSPQAEEEEESDNTYVIIGSALAGTAALAAAGGVIYKLQAGEPAPLDVEMEGGDDLEDDTGPVEMEQRMESRDYAAN